MTMNRRVFNHQEGGISNSRQTSAPRLVTKKNGFRKLMGPILLTIIGLLIGFILYQNDNFKTQLHMLAEEANEELGGKIAALNEKLGSANEKIYISSTNWEKRLKQETEKVQSLEHKLAKMDQKNKEIEAKHENEELLISQLCHLRAEIQRHDKNAVLEKFGEGPHRVEFKLDFPPDEVPEGTSDSFIIEMASIDLMPHTVHFFLEQASKGLLDGCSFHRNAGHVVQGGPISNHLNPGVNVRKPFADADLKSVSFQEYHPDFPHKKYTLGYAGRPGGPDFYVSTLDNTRNHGPGGQASYAVASEADPCFAKVVEGFEAVDRMQKMSVKPDDYSGMNHYVAIKTVKILDH
jgi:cyclophilin family peptidyl-prolyl cis-trans isomerase